LHGAEKFCACDKEFFMGVSFFGDCVFANHIYKGEPLKGLDQEIIEAYLKKLKKRKTN